MTRFTFVLIALLLGACEAKNPNTDYDGWDRQVWTDPATGCQYLFWQVGQRGYNNYAMVLTPRIDSDRMPICKK